MIPGAEIHYYFEALDGTGITSVLPAGAPDETFEMSILPIDATVSTRWSSRSTMMDMLTAP